MEQKYDENEQKKVYRKNETLKAFECNIYEAIKIWPTI